jgi:hypothetical protein
MPDPITNPHGINIDMSQFTDNVTTDNVEGTVSGTGIFDILMNTVTKHLKAQFESNRVRQEDYAQLYAQLYQQSLGAAVQIWLQKPLMDLQKLEIEAKIELYKRQIKGFDDDFKIKLLKTCMDGWSVAISMAKEAVTENEFPSPVQEGTITNLFNDLCYPSVDNYEYKDGKHPDAESRDPVDFKVPPIRPDFNPRPAK